MPKTTAVDLHAFVDAVEAEREAGVCPSVRVYGRGLEPLEGHLLPGHWVRGVGAGSGGGEGAACAPASSVSDNTRVATSRSRSPVRRQRTRWRFAGGGSDPEPVDAGPLEEWDGHFDGLVRPFRHGFVLAVEDALVDGHENDRRRSLFVDAFGENRVLGGERVLEECLRRHLAGGRWEEVERLWEALREVARAELGEGSVGALRLLSA